MDKTDKSAKVALTEGLDQLPERAGLLAQIEACRRDVAQWPEWMRQERTAPAWMLGWDD